MTTSTSNRTPKALLLDDDATVLRLLGTALEARGVEVRAATGAEAGLALLVDELLDLDLLVVDLDLPGRDGRELLHLVRHAGGERDLRIAVLASAPGRAVREQLRALGADLVVDRAAGTARAVEALAALAGAAPAPRRWTDAARPALAGALCIVRGALAPSPRLAPAGA